MKYISPTERILLASRAKLRWQKSLRRRSVDSGLKTIFQDITPQPLFNLSEDYETTVSCLRELKTAALSRAPRRTRVNIKIDLAPITSISPAAALVLAAEIDRWRKIKNARLTPHRPDTWDAGTLKMLTDLGFFELLGTEPDPTWSNDPTGELVTVLPLITCNTLDLPRIAAIEDHLRKVATAFQQEPSIYTALTEAAYNSIKHGYPNGTKFEFQPIRNQWWATGCWSPQKSEVKLVLYDQGVGIPATLPAWDHWEKLTSWLSARHEVVSMALKEHAAVIEAALEVSRTSLTSGHGQGLQDVIAPVDVLGGGKVRILSGKGQLTYTGSGKISKSERSQHLGGTLIEWTIPVH